jgi:carboxyl-terminal processing protease
LSPVVHVFSFVAGFLILGGAPYAAYAGDQQLTPNQRIVAEVWKSVDKQFYDRTFNGHDDWFKLRDEFVRKRSYNSKEEVYESVAELLSKLDDPYTRFLTPAKLDSLVNSATSTVGGIGVELLDGTKTGLSLSTTSEAANCAVVVGDVQPNSPAEREGLVRGDAFEIVDGVSVCNRAMSPDDVASLLRGNAGSSVGVTVLRKESVGQAISLDFKLRRETIKIQTVLSRVLKISESADRGKVRLPRQIGVIRIKAFSTSSSEDVREALQALLSGSTPLSLDSDAIVLDLRNNQGGLLPGGIDTARLFLEKGSTVVSVTNSKGAVVTESQDMQPYFSGDKAIPPLFVLVNRNTASAAEVLTAALRENDRAVIVGENTFGKGIVQNIVRLRENTGVAVTTSVYNTPSGKSINKIGIKPDRNLDCGPLEVFDKCLLGHEDAFALE